MGRLQRRPLVFRDACSLPDRMRTTPLIQAGHYRSGVFSMNKPARTPLKLMTARLKIQSQRETTLNRRITHIAAAFGLAVVLGGCGGGGGGGSPGLNPVFVYPTLPDAIINSANSGVTSNYTKTFNQLAPAMGTVSGILNSPAQSLTINVSGIGSEAPFSFTVNNPATLGVVLNNSPLNSCPNCLRDIPVSASDSQPVRFIYLDPASTAALTYSTLGLWSKSPLLVGNSDVGAAFSIGVVTRAQDLPILPGTNATYNGFMVGRYANGLDTYVVGANATATASFSPGPNSSVVFSTIGTVITLEGGGPLLPQSGLNLNGNLTYSSGSNSLTGTLTAPGLAVPGGMSGAARARYYGPPTGVNSTPAEFGGAFFVANGLEQMNGSFALKKP